MKNLPTTLFFLVFSYLIVSNQAVAVGLGVAVMNDHSVSSIPFGSTAVVIPIYVTDEFEIEPFVTYKSFRSRESDGPSFDATSMELGVGLFLRADHRSKLSTYYGFRISQLSAELNFEPLSSASSQDEYDVIFITPLIGLESGVFESMSFGIELGMSIMEGSFTDGNNSSNNDDINSYSIHSAIVLRYHVM